MNIIIHLDFICPTAWDIIDAMKLTKKDSHWLYAFPIYILINSLRHQLANLLAVWMTGGSVLHFSLLPTFSPSGWLRFSSLQWSGGKEWVILGAPYLLDLLTFLLFGLILLKTVVKQRGLFINLFILGIASPIFNSGYDYFSTVFVDTDISRLITYVPYVELVHLYFVVTLSFFILASQYILRNSPTARYFREKATAERRRLKQEKKQKKTALRVTKNGAGKS